jgi:hypothetical protein
MFQADASIKHMKVIRGGKGRSQEIKGASTMNTLLEYKFAEFKSESSVASGVTMLVSAWFLVAAGAILADPASPYTQRAVVKEAAASSAVTTVAEAPPANLIPVVATAPAARFTITVEAKRLKV